MIIALRGRLSFRHQRQRSNRIQRGLLHPRAPLLEFSDFSSHGCEPVDHGGCVDRDTRGIVKKKRCEKGDMFNKTCKSENG